MKIIFFGTDGVALKCLEALTESFEVALVVTVPDKPVGRNKEMMPSEIAFLAQELGLPTFKPESLKSDDVEKTLRGINADCFVVAVYGKIIPQNILDIPRLGSINVHPSLLPLYRGPSPIRTPLLNGDKVTGVSIMKMDAQMDHGPVYSSVEIDIDIQDDNLKLTEKLSGIAAPLLVSTLQKIENGEAAAHEQDHTGATFTRLFTKEDGRVDWKKSAREIYNQWRACQEWPGIYTTWNSKMLKITECHLTEQVVAEKQAGEVLSGGLVVCGDGGLLQIAKLQLEGKHVVPIKEFLNGYKNFIGSILK